MEQQILDFLKDRNIQISTKTKARGHLGFFCNDKIAISKNLSGNKKLEVLIHEFAHKIHSEIEPERFKTGGSLEQIFQTDKTEKIAEELYKVTNFVDENSKFLNLEKMRSEYAEKVKLFEDEIKKEFPNFAKSKKFAEYDRYQRKTNCKSKFFLKYDHVKIMTPFLFKNEFYSIEKIDTDFPDLPTNFKNYFYLLSNYRKQKKVQNKIAKLKRYYQKPTELFARFVEGLIKDKNMVEQLAPNTFYRFQYLLMQGHFNDLAQLLKLVESTKR